MKTLIDRINEFENSPDWSVRRFNQLFPLCTLENVDPEAEVEIGVIADTDTTRWLSVGSLTVKHSFQPRKELVQLMDENEHDSEV